MPADYKSEGYITEDGEYCSYETARGQTFANTIFFGVVGVFYVIGVLGAF